MASKRRSRVVSKVTCWDIEDPEANAAPPSTRHRLQIPHCHRAAFAVSPHRRTPTGADEPTAAAVSSSTTEALRQSSQRGGTHHLHPGFAC